MFADANGRPLPRRVLHRCRGARGQFEALSGWCGRFTACGLVHAPAADCGSRAMVHVRSIAAAALASALAAVMSEVLFRGGSCGACSRADSWHPSDPQLTRRRRAKAGPRASPPLGICLLCRVCVVCGGGVAGPRLWRALEALSARVRPAAPRCARILPKGDRPVDASPDRCAA